MKSFYHQQDLYLCQSETCNEEEEQKELISITQSLSREQYQFEFPTKSCLEALKFLDKGENKYSFFDPSSFTAAALSSAHMNYHETTMVDDSRLSPLQLPSRHSMTRESSCESLVTIKQSVNPSSFLSRLDSPESDNELIPVMDFDNSTVSDTLKTTSESRILIQLNKYKYNSPITIIHTRYSASISDEGYDDSEDSKELESECFFYSIQDDQELVRDRAAIKIQSLWRGYISRRRNQQPLSLQISQLLAVFHRRQMNHFQRKVEQLEKKVSKMSLLENRLEQLEKRLEQETAMRRAFENTVEDMTVLIDQQQKVLYDRLEEEVSLRQSYEHRMNQALDQIELLESRVKKEVTTRNKMEDMMTCILDKMHEAEEARQQQVLQDSESRKLMQTKLDRATEEINRLKNMKKTDSSNTKRLTDTKQTLVPKKTLVTKTRETRTPITRRQPSPSHELNRQKTTITPTKRTLMSSRK
ncbi:hypothetical protein G6F46_010660 [Rhizopus delemar]|uniref:Uncharacterized protein n=3 Tax=Rhizopus TaxID=4842 RepID=I1BST2_RHIO9|nr:hypothetical protein RO3G_03967 [Rhizopus delemar RA 99-880]KAG1459825.1 hypothetical protein G6F55_004531 [Rhizopus delemar]KAG1536321.1 hypothetical protein G6F51_011034 [Rhizopus arrhizus]KAG1493497.1 hypothetical protein G6F54_008535 [Rhizopus delemar]KAG1504040.1 hypothetical protein G6F53_010485 [Rhizopus delemar]|eukprot:EIE79262.1 hypothetical protein RO3G_03967 [Rhizopus delemar RA 99-880]